MSTSASCETRPITKPRTTTVATGRPLTPPSPTAFRMTRYPGFAAGDERAVAAAGTASTARIAQLSRNRRMEPPGYAWQERPTTPRSCVVMTDDRLQRRADGLAARVEALAEALQASGASEEASAKLLSQAAAAVLQALRLELLVEQSGEVAA